MLHYRCKAAALSVQGCCTDGAGLLSSNNPAKKTTYLIKKNDLLNINKAVTFCLCN